MNDPQANHPNIYTALSAVMDDTRVTIEKRQSAGLSYAFASVEEMIAVVRPALIKHGVAIFPSGVRDLVRGSQTNSKGTVIHTVSATYLFTLAHGASGTKDIAEVSAEGNDSGDKAANKASTAAYKTMIKQTFMIETSEAETPQRKASKPPSAPAEDKPLLEAGKLKNWFIRAAREQADETPCTSEQASYVASLMSEAFKEEAPVDAVRYDILSRLTARAIQSTGNLTKGECSVLIDRFTRGGKGLSDYGKAELLALLEAVKAPHPPVKKVGGNGSASWDQTQQMAFWKDQVKSGVSREKLFQAAQVTTPQEFFADYDPDQAKFLLDGLRKG